MGPLYNTSNLKVRLQVKHLGFILLFFIYSTISFALLLWHCLPKITMMCLNLLKIC